MDNAPFKVSISVPEKEVEMDNDEQQRNSFAEIGCKILAAGCLVAAALGVGTLIVLAWKGLAWAISL